jgi:hypothetical protein
MLAPWLSLCSAEIVREVADRLASDRDGFFVHKCAPSMPNDQAIRHRQIRVIRATGTYSESPFSRGTMPAFTLR